MKISDIYSRQRNCYTFHFRERRGKAWKKKRRGKVIYRCFPPENSSWTIPKVSREIKRLARMLMSLFRYVYCSSQVSGRNIEFKHKVRRRDMKYEVVIFHHSRFEANSMALKPLLVYEYVPTSFPIKILNYDINCMKIVYNFAWMSCKQSSSLCKRWDILVKLMRGRFNDQLFPSRIRKRSHHCLKIGYAN